MNSSNEDDAYKEAIEQYNIEKTFKTLGRTPFIQMVDILKKAPWKLLPIDQMREILLKENGWTREEYQAELQRRIIEAQNG